jgi:chaperonin GroEL
MSTRYDGMGLDVARIAANGDEEVAKIVTEALQMAGKNGIVSVDSSRTDKTHIEFSAGMRFDSGFRHPDFITDFSRNECVLENPFILLHERRIQSIGKIEPLLAAVAQAGRSILILSEEFELPVMALLLQNRAVLRSCVVTAPWYGERRRDFLSDLAAFTGGISIVEELGLDLSKCDLSVLGQAERVVVTRTNTTIIKGKSKGNELAQRIESLSSAIASTENPYDKEILAERLAKLDGGVAVIKIGAPTESEAKEKRDRTEDAVLSVKCAQEDGTVPGGGIALLRCQESVNFSGEKLHNEELVGIGIVFHALEAPLKQILENGGYNVKDTMKCLKGRADSIGFDALSGEVVDMRDKGIMDASKVVKQALINAASLAGTFLTVAGSIVNLEAKGA